MIRAVRWWPTGLAGTILAMAALYATATHSPASELTPLPSPLRVTYGAPTDAPPSKRLIFDQPTSPSSSAAPVDAPAKNPILMGIASGSRAAVALLKKADGQTVPAHVGDVVDGWSVRSISTKKTTIAKGNEEQELGLSDATK